MGATAPAEAPPRVRIAGLAKAFGGNRVLRGVDLDIAAGESVVAIGASGAGKSVLVKCLIGLVAPDEGVIELDGEPVLGPPGRRRADAAARFGMLFQHGALFDSLTALGNVVFALDARRRRPAAEAREAAMEKLALVGLGAAEAALHPAELAAGARKRVALARAIAAEPDILLFDEPTTGLDPIAGAAIDSLISRLVRELGATALTITHDMASARRVGDRIAMLYDGRVRWIGPASEIDRSGDERVDRFVRGVPPPAGPGGGTV